MSRRRGSDPDHSMTTTTASSNVTYSSTATVLGTGTSTATKSGNNMDHASETADKMRWFSAPRILSVSATSVVISWTKVHNAKTYILQRWDPAVTDPHGALIGGWKELYKGAELTWKDQNREPASKCKYRARAVYSDGQGLWSSVVETTTKDQEQTVDDLHSAILNFDVDTVYNQLASGVNINGRDQHAYTPLMSASDRGLVAIVKELLKRDADLNCLDRCGHTALLIACDRGHASVVSLLLEHNAKIDHVDYTGATALHAAVHSGSMSIAETLLDAGADINHRDTVAGWTPLFHAAAFGASNDMCTMLVERGASVDMKDNDKKTALMIATIMNKTDLVKVLMRFTDPAATKTDWGNSAEDFAVTFGNAETKNALAIPDDQLNNL